MGKNYENSLFPTIRDFLMTYLPKQRNCSPSTAETYRTALNQLLDYAKEQNRVKLVEVTFDMLDSNLILAFLDYLETEKACSVRTRNNKLNGIRAFFKYAVLKNPSYAAYQIEVLKVPYKEEVKRRDIDYLSEKAIQEIFKQPDTSTSKGVRNLFLMILMYDTAGRIQEILSLRLCDFKLDGTPQVKLHGKGNKYRVVPLMRATVSHLKRYLDAFHPEVPMCSEEPLFYTVRKGEKFPLSDDMVRVFMNKYAQAAHNTCAEVPEKIHPHLFRHSRAMHLYQHGMDLTLISQWLGHVSYTTTLIYAYADTEMKRAAIEKATDGKFTDSIPSDTSYDVNDDDVLRHLYGLS
jgi:site-specific recombinase XerD